MECLVEGLGKAPAGELGSLRLRPGRRRDPAFARRARKKGKCTPLQPHPVRSSPPSSINEYARYLLIVRRTVGATPPNSEQSQKFGPSCPQRAATLVPHRRRIYFPETLQQSRSATLPAISSALWVTFLTLSVATSAISRSRSLPASALPPSTSREDSRPSVETLGVLL